jgi:hypothetical protein
MKICSKCKEPKELSEFAKTGRKEGLYSSLCCLCSSLKASSWNKKNPEKRRLASRRNKLKTQYGITIEQYDEMVLAQNGKCLICKNERKLVVDHSHVTGIVRGLLCNSCNRGIGYLQDNPEVTKEAVIYLEKHANS